MDPQTPTPLHCRSVVRAAMELHLDDFTAEVTPSGWGYYTARCQEPGESLVYPDHAAEKGYHLDTTSGWIHVLPGAKPVPDAFYGGKSVSNLCDVVEPLWRLRCRCVRVQSHPQRPTAMMSRRCPDADACVSNPIRRGPP